MEERKFDVVAWRTTSALRGNPLLGANPGGNLPCTKIRLRDNHDDRLFVQKISCKYAF